MFSNWDLKLHATVGTFLSHYIVTDLWWGLDVQPGLLQNPPVTLCDPSLQGWVTPLKNKIVGPLHTYLRGTHAFNLLHTLTTFTLVQQGRTARINRSSSHQERRIQRGRKKMLYFFFSFLKFFQPVKWPGSEVALVWQCCTNLNYPLPGCAGPPGHVALFPPLLT